MSKIKIKETVLYRSDPSPFISIEKPEMPATFFSILMPKGKLDYNNFINIGAGGDYRCEVRKLSINQEIITKDRFLARSLRNVSYKLEADQCNDPFRSPYLNNQKYDACESFSQLLKICNCGVK